MNRRTTTIPALLILCVCALSSCGGASESGKNPGVGGEGEVSHASKAPQPENRPEIRIQGSDTMLQLCTAWADRFRSKNPGVRISILGGGSGIGISGLINGECDLASASRKIKSSESELAARKGLKLEERLVARDGISIVVNKSNRVSSLTQEQVTSIFSGSVRLWSEVGGGDDEIVVLTRDKDSGTYGFFLEHFMGSGGSFSDAASVLASNTAIVDTVAETPGAIGYVGLGYFDEARERIKALAISGSGAPATLPSLASVKDGTYPVSRTLHFYFKAGPAGALADFIGFATGPEGQKIVTESGFVPIG